MSARRITNGRPVWPSLFPGLVLDFVGRLGWETMVQMDVRIVEVRRDQLRQLGLRWDSDVPGPEVSVQAGGGQGVRVSATLATTLGSRIDLLQQRGLAQTVAEPTLSCRSGGVARFISGGEVPIPVTDGLGAVDVQYKEYGVILEVRPRAESNGGIYAEVDVELSQVDSSVRVRDYPGFRKAQDEHCNQCAGRRDHCSCRSAGAGAQSGPPGHPGSRGPAGGKWLVRLDQATTAPD